jgi:MtN3 and saliva related transmembrane protein
MSFRSIAGGPASAKAELARVVEIIGWLAACGTTLSFVPQVLLALRTRDVSGISIPMYVTFCVGVALWIAYGFCRHSLPIIGANVVTLSLALVILFLTVKYRRSDAC